MNEIVLQVCNKCLDEKDVDLFPKNGGLVCKRCRGLQFNEWRNKNKDLVAKAKRNEYLSNKNQYIEVSRNWYKKNKPHAEARQYFARSGIHLKEIPAGLLAAKIEQLKLIHLIKELQDEDRK